MAKLNRVAARPQQIAQPAQPDPVSQALTQRYRDQHAQPGQPPARSPRLVQQQRESTNSAEYTPSNFNQPVSVSGQPPTSSGGK